VPANPWELRADVRPLEAAAQRWAELGELMSRRGDEIVDAARRATERWDAEAAESYENHRRQVLLNLDRFTELTGRIASTLTTISSIITSSQKELDTAWSKVALIPHEVVGESRYLVFKPSEDDDRGKVTAGQQETEQIRGRLQLLLDSESTRLREARAEFTLVRTELKTLAGGFFPEGVAPGEDPTGVGTVPPPSTSVPGMSQAGVTAASLAPIGSISVSMPDLGGISAAPIAGLSAAAIAGRRGGSKQSSAGVPPIGGMGAGAMGARAGTMSRGMASGRAGARRMPTPRLEGQGGSRSGGAAAADEDEATRAAREKEAAREAKRAALEEKRAERAARKAEREREEEERGSTDGVAMESVEVGADLDEPDDLADDLDDADGEAATTDGTADQSSTETDSERGASRR
jgi:hypothetical protein